LKDASANSQANEGDLTSVSTFNAKKLKIIMPSKFDGIRLLFCGFVQPY